MKLTMPPYDAELVAAIEEHLEQDYWTEIESEVAADSTPGCNVTFARGARRKAYSCPMIQVFQDGVSSGMSVLQPACPACGDFSRSWKCDVHDRPEKPVEGFDLGPALGDIYRLQDQYLEAQRALMSDLLDGGDITPIGPRMVEVNGETVEGMASFTFEATRRRSGGNWASNDPRPVRRGLLHGMSLHRAARAGRADRAASAGQELRPVRGGPNPVPGFRWEASRPDALLLVEGPLQDDGRKGGL